MRILPRSRGRTNPYKASPLMGLQVVTPGPQVRRGYGCRLDRVDAARQDKVRRWGGPWPQPTRTARAD